MSEADLRTLIEEALLDMDPELNISPGSPAQTKVVDRVLAYVGEDPFDTDIDRFLRTRLAQEFPQLSEENAAALSDLLISPYKTLNEPIAREINVMKQRQSLVNVGIHTEDSMGALLSNVFMDREEGQYAQGSVRLYYSSPQYVAATSDVRCYDANGHNFFPNGDQYISLRQMLFNKEGDEYYFDVLTVAQEAGEVYNVEPDTIKYVDGLSGVKRLTNRFKMQAGLDRETNELYLNRAQNYPTEAALNARRGILYVIQNAFPQVDQIEVVGYGDTDMQRDRLTGLGYGPIAASAVGPGITFPVEDGDYDDYTDQIRCSTLDFITILGIQGEVSDRASIALSWVDKKAIAQVSEHEIVEVIDTDIIQIADRIDIDSINALLVRFHSLTLSDIPGGFLFPNQTEVPDGVHIGGAIDVYVKDKTPADEIVDMAIVSDETYIVITDEAEITSGSSQLILKDVDDIRVLVHESTGNNASTDGAATHVHFLDIKPGSTYYTIPQTLEPGDVLYFPTLNKYYEITGLDTSSYATGLIAYLNGTPVSGARPYKIYKYHGGITKGMVAYLTSGEPGAYRIFEATGWVSSIFDRAGIELTMAYEFTTSAAGVGAKIYDNVEINLTEPKAIKIADVDLTSIIGSDTVRSTTGHDFLALGVQEDDTLRILAGVNEGDFTVLGIVGPGNSYLKLTSTMPFSVGSQSYQVFTLADAVDPPLLHVTSMELLNADLQPEGVDIPLGKPLAGITSDFTNMSRGARYETAQPLTGAWGTVDETEPAPAFPVNGRTLKLRFTFPTSGLLVLYTPITLTFEFTFPADYSTAQDVADYINTQVGSLGAEYAFDVKGHVVLRPLGDVLIEVLIPAGSDAADTIGWVADVTTTNGIMLPEDPTQYGVNVDSDYCYIESGPNGGQLFTIDSISASNKVVYLDSKRAFLKPTDEDRVVLGFLSTGNVRFYFRDPTYFAVNQSTVFTVDDGGVTKQYIPDPTLSTTIYPVDGTKAVADDPLDVANEQIVIPALDAYSELIEDYFDDTGDGLRRRGDIAKVSYRRMWFSNNLSPTFGWTSPATMRISVGESIYREIDLDDLPSAPTGDIDELIDLVNAEFTGLASKIELSSPTRKFLAFDSEEEIKTAPNFNFETAIGPSVPKDSNKCKNFGEWPIMDVTAKDTLKVDGTLVFEDGLIGATGTADPEVQVEILRPGLQRMCTTVMSTQTENGYYYADMEFVSLGVGDDFNIAPELYGSAAGHKCYGYTLRNTNPVLAFSTEEEVFAVITSQILELDVDCTPSNSRLIAGKNVRVNYKRSDTTDDVHTFITADTERVVCASVVAKHLLPTYVKGTLNYTGQVDEATALTNLTDLIEGLSPDDRLEISDVTALLSNFGATYIQTPLVLAALVQDTDRDIYVRFIEDTRELGDLVTYFVDELTLVRLS